MNRDDRQTGFSAVETIIVVLVVAALAVTGFMVYRYDKSTTKMTGQYNDTAGQQLQTDPYEGWQTYASSVEQASFKYPTDWSEKALDASTEIELISPSKNISILWNGQMSGVGGACDPTVMPGSLEAATNSPGACPYWKILDKQKLAGADLYYVAGVVTFDGTHYAPWFALQDSRGILESGGNIGYLAFMGKHNNIIDAEGRDLGVALAELHGGDSNQPPFGSSAGTETEDQAKMFFSTTEAQQAKLILLSYTYQN